MKLSNNGEEISLLNEHKKMYKAGKKWLTAIITVAAITFLGGITTTGVHADATANATVQTESTQSQQNASVQVEQQSKAVTNKAVTNNDNNQATTDENANAVTEDQATSTNTTDHSEVTVSQAKANASNQWVHYDQGWSYTDSQGNWVYNQWQHINNNWYYFNNAGYAQTGWFKSGAGNWFYFDNQNAWALTGWQKINNNWYYFDPTNAWADRGWFQSGAGNWYYFDWNNAWALTGWQKINNTWYYFDPTNAWMDTGWQTINGKSYYFEPSGAWNSSKQNDGLTGTWENHGQDGDIVYWKFKKADGTYANSGWAKINNKWYYFDKDGDINYGILSDGGHDYYLQFGDGSLATNGWYQYKGNWIYAGSDGSLYVGWHQIGNYWYYFVDSNDVHNIVSDGLYYMKSQNKFYDFDNDGHLLTNRSVKLNGKTYYIDGNGVVQGFTLPSSDNWLLSSDCYFQVESNGHVDDNYMH